MSLNVARVGIWSVTAMTFLVCLAVGLLDVGMAIVAWLIVNKMGFFAAVNSTISQALGTGSTRINVLDYVGLPQVVSVTVVAAAVGTVGLTAFAAVAALLYNTIAALVGGVRPLLVETHE